MLNIHTAQVMALGDADNDIGMLQTAGIGVAMTNATRKFKQLPIGSPFPTKKTASHMPFTASLEYKLYRKAEPVLFDKPGFIALKNHSSISHSLSP